MPSTNKTEKLGLNQFVDTDKPNWSDYTRDMELIDNKTLDRATYDPTNVGDDAFRASNQRMTGYVKSNEYAAITPSDNASVAIGKLEAGVAATGDMKKATYDTDGDGKVDSAEYADEAGSVQWASVIGRPSVLPNPNALKLQLNGADVATYTGGAAATVNITANSIGAASLVSDKVPSSQLDIVDATDSTEKTKLASANSVRMAKEEAIAAGQSALDETSAILNSNLTQVNQDIDTLNEKTEITLQIANRIYPGVDLTIKFADEIAAAPYNGNPWAWVKARIQAGSFAGIDVGDYIPWEATNGYKVKSEVAGIDTYYNYGDIPVGHHIDFISRDCWPETIPFNLANYNNGTSVSPHPWLASNLYAKLNSLQMDVPNATTANPALVAVDYRTSGVYDKLPTALQNVIVTKRALLPGRYTEGALLSDDNSFNWENAGKLWIPSEVEVYGMEHFGSKNGYSGGGYQQYPILSTGTKRVKGHGDSGAQRTWWISSSRTNSTAGFVYARSNGTPSNGVATFATASVPVCFRIAQ